MKSQPTTANSGAIATWLDSTNAKRSLVIALLLLLAAASYARAQVTGGRWTAVVAPFPGGLPAQALLLTDGTVMVQEFCYTGFPYCNGNWWRLIPDQYGNYASGSWKATASMPPGYAPFAFSAAVLINGRVIVEGGEQNAVSFGLLRR